MGTIVTAVPLQAENLLRNPNFDSSAQFWDGLGSAGSFVHDATRGSPATGSVSVSANGMMETSFGVFQCVSITGGFPITFGVRARQGATLPGIPAGQDFAVHSGNVVSASNARSAQLLANPQVNTNGSSIQAWFDSMLLDTNNSLFAISFDECVTTWVRSCPTTDHT